MKPIINYLKFKGSKVLLYSITFTRTLVYFLFKWETWILMRNIFIIFLADSLIMDDEPLWEPIEWSMLQMWLLWIFFFAWIAEILIDARYGGYTGRDKRVWYGWYNSFFFIDMWYIISFGVVFFFISTPFYYELTYHISAAVTWWNWINRVYICKILFLNFILNLWFFFLQTRIHFLHWSKVFLYFLILEFFFLMLLFWALFTFCFAYLSDPLWVVKQRPNMDVGLSIEPLKWGWGLLMRDNFPQHSSTAAIWFKTDGPWGTSLLLLSGFFLLSLFFINFFLISFLRKVWALQEAPITYTTYVISSIRHSFISFFLIFFLLFMSWISFYWRFPIELNYATNSTTWRAHFFDLCTSFFL